MRIRIRGSVKIGWLVKETTTKQYRKNVLECGRVMKKKVERFC